MKSRQLLRAERDMAIATAKQVFEETRAAAQRTYAEEVAKVEQAEETIARIAQGAGKAGAK